MLVSISIIALLIALLLPAIKQSRELTKRVVCSSQQKQILMSLLTFSGENSGAFPMGHWGTPGIMGNGGEILEMLGGWYTGMDENDGPLKLFECPSRNPGELVHASRVIYHNPGPTGSVGYGFLRDSIRGTYTYVGGPGSRIDGGTGLPSHGGLWWRGWVAYDGGTWNRYEDIHGFGPVPRMSMRTQHTKVALLTDRMWLTEGYSQNYNPNNWSDCCSVIDNNHKNQDGSPTGGNVGMIDGHVEWRNANIIKERVHAYTLYRPFVCY